MAWELFVEEATLPFNNNNNNNHIYHLCDIYIEPKQLIKVQEKKVSTKEICRGNQIDKRDRENARSTDKQTQTDSYIVIILAVKTLKILKS